jgi:hypothetical protein
MELSYREEVVGSSPIPPTQEPLRVGVFVFMGKTGRMHTPHSLSVQAMPCRVIDTKGTYSIVDTPYVHLLSSYPLSIGGSQTSRGKIVETLFIIVVYHARNPNR